MGGGQFAWVLGVLQFRHSFLFLFLSFSITIKVFGGENSNFFDNFVKTSESFFLQPP